jgi:hypothetical protein
MHYGTLATRWSFGCNLARLAAEVATDLEETYLAAERSGDESLAGGFGQRCGSRVKRVCVCTVYD